LGYLRRKKFDLLSPETISDEKSLHLAGLSHRGENIRQNRGSLAGDTALVAPVSRRIEIFKQACKAGLEGVVSKAPAAAIHPAAPMSG
jgi:hypothetical protein